MQNNAIPIKAVAYLRRSTPDKQEQSIFNQRSVIEKYAKEHNFEIMKYFIDDGISGTDTRSRKAFLDMISEGTKRGCPFSALLVLDLSRFSRADPDESAHWEYVMKMNGVRTIYVAEPLSEENTLGDKIIKSIQRIMSEQFSKEQAKKTIRGSITYTKLGYSVGGCPPYGYDRLLVDKNGKPIKVLKPGQRKSEKTEHVRYVLGDPEKVKVVKEIFDMVANQGLGLRKVCKKLNQAKIPAPKGGLFEVSGVRNIAKNPVYTGTKFWNRANRGYTYDWSHDTIDVKIGEKKTKFTRWKNREQWVACENAHEPIIDKELFDRVQQVLTAKRIYFSVGKAPYMSAKIFGKPERKNLILKKIEMHEIFTLAGLAKEFGVTKTTIERDIEGLKMEGKIRFIGPNRRGHFELLRKTQNDLFPFSLAVENISGNISHVYKTAICVQKNCQ